GVWSMTSNTVAGPVVRRNPWGRIGALMVLVCAGAAMAACSPSPGTPVSGPSGGPPTATQGASSPSAGSGSPVLPSAGSGQAAVPGDATVRCARPDVVVSLGTGGAGAGHRSGVLVFTNHGSRPCQLVGSPGVAAVDAGGAQVAQARRTLNGYLGG